MPTSYLLICLFLSIRYWKVKRYFAAINLLLKSTIQGKLYSIIIIITVKNLSEKIQSQFPDTKKVPAQNTLYTQYVL